MELIQHTLSWTTFFWSCLVLALIWLLSTKTTIGKNIVLRETRWQMTQWSRLLLVLVVTLFILVNPLLHLLAVAVLGVLYYVLVADSNTKSKLIDFGDSRKPSGLPLGIGSTTTTEQILVCTATDMASLLKEKQTLDKCLFSFPYIKDNPYPSIQYLDGKYNLTLRLTSDKYLASLVQYLRHAGFETVLKQN